MERIIEYKCVICGKKVKGRKASRKMKQERVCQRCLLEYVLKVEEVYNNEDKVDKK